MKMKMNKAVLLMMLMIAGAGAVALALGDEEDGGSYYSSVDVFHRNSPVSPYYDPSLNPTQILMRDIRRSRRFSSTTGETQTLETILYPVGGGFVMRIYVGSPPIEQIVSVDTGSTLLWVQCDPCERCNRQNVVKFDRTRSQTYQVLGCDDYLCDSYEGFTSFCHQQRIPQCSYHLVYADKTRSSGELALESIGLTVNEIKRGVLFGCGTNNAGFIYPDESGVCGFGPSKPTLVSQLMNGKIIFSYCLTPIESKVPGKLKFLSENETMANQPGVITTLMIHDAHYIITIGGISVQDDPGMIVVNSSNAELVLDSGTALIQLPTDLYVKVEQQVVKFMRQAGREPIDIQPYPFYVCYFQTNFDGLPDFSFHLLSNQTIRFTVNQMWVLQEEYDAMCLMIVPHSDDICLLGNRAMINLKMEYNVMQGLLSLNTKQIVKLKQPYELMIPNYSKYV